MLNTLIIIYLPNSKCTRPMEDEEIVFSWILMVWRGLDIWNGGADSEMRSKVNGALAGSTSGFSR